MAPGGLNAPGALVYFVTVRYLVRSVVRPFRFSARRWKVYWPGLLLNEAGL